MVRYGFLAVILMGLAATTALAGDIVVLTKTPVAEFALPDGSVLENAYVWRRSSQGLMIMHDGGNYFLNFKLLPDDWKAAYLGAPGDGESPADFAPPPMHDLYKAGALLEKIPDLTAAGRQHLLRKDLSEELDQDLLALSLLQSLLSNKRDEATRFSIIIEEKQYRIEEAKVDRMIVSCGYCDGDGELVKPCKVCGGSGECPRCNGEGLRESMQGGSRDHCTTCRGTGDCQGCKGKGELTLSCPKCGGTGKLVDRQYCEIVRDHLVRQVNASAMGGKRASVASGSTFGIGKALSDLPELDPVARDFYLSETYAGGMDAGILGACVLHSLIKSDFEGAERLNRILQVEFPDDKEFVAGNYLKPCGACKKKGWIERDCRKCGGSGECDRCEGSGQRSLEDGRSKEYCTTCHGTGECQGCGGDGKTKQQCPACKGRGRIFERQRAEIKLGLLVDGLNEYHSVQ